MRLVRMRRTNCKKFFFTALTIGVCNFSFLFYRAWSSKMRLSRMRRANCTIFFLTTLTIGVCYFSFLFYRAWSIKMRLAQMRPDTLQAIFSPL